LSFLLLAPAAGALAAGQAPTQPSFKTGVQLVRIDVSVLDDQRQPVRGLQASDFTVLEDGQPRPVRAFKSVDLAAATAAAALTPAMTPSLATGVATNRVGDDTSRLIFILMDRSIPAEGGPMTVARRIADAAVDAMAPGDLAAVVTTGGGVPQNLTSDRARLHKTIAGSDWSQGPSQAQQDDPLIGKYDPLSDGRCLCGLCVMDTITRIANEMLGVPRRKVLLFVGSNIIVQAGPRAPSLDPGCESRVRDSRERLFDALGASGLTVHSIDPNGVASVGPQSRASVPNGQPQLDPAKRLAMLTEERNDLMKAQGNLDVLPALTGGRTILDNNEPYRMVPDVLHESDVYYLLAFEPIEEKGDVRHRIQVKVARKGLHVHTARYTATSAAGTAAAPASAASPLDRALTDLLPDASLPIDMSVATVAGPDRDHAYVGVTLDASSFAAAPGIVPLEMALSASDERGRRVGGAHQETTIEVPSGVATDPGRSPIELQTYVTLPPGEYELRAALMNRTTRAASSVFTHITVPPFDASTLSLSDLVLGSSENGDVLPEAAPAIPIAPTTARAFEPNTSVWAFLRVYRTEGKSEAPVTLDTSILDAAGTVVDHQSEQLEMAAFDGRSADVRRDVPLINLEAGRYVLRIEARQGPAAASRTVAFTVQP
jgi:VWFA-related protein